MRPRDAIASLLHLLTVLSFFLAGLFFFALPYLPEVRIRLAHFLLNRFEICTSIALGLFLATLFLLIGFYSLNRGKVLKVAMGKNSLSIDSAVIQKTLETHFKKEKIRLLGVEIVNGKKLEVSVSLPSIEDEAREQLLSQVEASLQTLLKDRFGYSGLFHLIVSQKTE